VPSDNTLILSISVIWCSLAGLLWFISEEYAREKYKQPVSGVKVFDEKADVITLKNKQKTEIQIQIWGLKK
jgi:hypothetical protein